jgi:hypothetical protein
MEIQKKLDNLMIYLVSSDNLNPDPLALIYFFDSYKTKNKELIKDNKKVIKNALKIIPQLKNFFKLNDNEIEILNKLFIDYMNNKYDLFKTEKADDLKNKISSYLFN